MKCKYLVIAVSFFVCLSTAQGQKKDLGLQNYVSAEKKCHQSIDKENWKVAESICKNALALANRLTNENKSEKMRAFENYAFTLFSQYKFQLALNNYTKAFEIGKTFLTESDAALGYAYFNLGRTNQGLSKPDKAVDYYQKAEQIYRVAYEKANDAELKTKHKESIKRTLILQKYIAGLLGDDSEFKEIEKKLADLEN